MRSLDDAVGYHDLAAWYDALYDARGKDYRAEAQALLGVAREDGREVGSLLDVACGTGRHLAVFADEVGELAGLDGSPEMLAVAASRLTREVPLVEGDLRAFDLARTFDVVTCLFSSIGHVADADELDAAVVAMARHVAPGGSLLVEPWLTPERVRDEGVRDLVTAENADGVVARAASSHRDGDVLVLQFAWAVATAGGVATAEETHRMPLFTAERYVAAVERAGLVGEWRDEVAGLGMGRGLLVGRRGTS
ncbi:class I SAM-dependent methyltransferase [Egicoccus halophilus]|uniref:class I SAM-dependent methyltransferase n=1 Tax=Egicoccus halophilus TaxID=1670830 RepID=UPI0013EE8EC6|nr:class I SAM-dependent methyltransferase [Egicoccus halophilus]